MTEHNIQIFMQFSEQICRFHSVNITDVNDDLSVHKLFIEFLISLNSAELLSVILKFKIEASVMLL